MIVLQGRLDSIIFHNPENGYTVAVFIPDAYQTKINIVGTLVSVYPGEKLRLEGDWEEHAKFGEQFSVKHFDYILPDTAKGIRDYLCSGIFKGLGRASADKLVAYFGPDTLKALDKGEEKLLKVPGIGKARAVSILAAWQEHHLSRNFMAFIVRAGVPPALGAKLLFIYGSEAFSLIKKDPYRISREMPELPFDIADSLALAEGFDKDSYERIIAGFFYILQKAASSGHVFLPEKNLLLRTSRLLNLDIKFLSPFIAYLEKEDDFLLKEYEDTYRVYLREMYRAEKGVAARLISILSLDMEDEIEAESQLEFAILEDLAIKLSEEQLESLYNILKHRVAILTGGPGTGKTTLIRSLCSIMAKKRIRLTLAAPTGRAARRLNEITGHRAFTIHKLLKYNQTTKSFEMNMDNPLELDMLIVDEVSMVDIVLMFHLLSALPLSSRILLVGDTSQLPAIGPGNVLSDLINSGFIPSFSLKTIFRQAEKSLIVLNAHKINKGLMPDTPLLSDEDLSEFYFIRKKSSESVLADIVELCVKRIPERFGFDPFTDIQVLTPMHKGVLGTFSLNKLLQSKMNPAYKEGDQEAFYLGDKVIHLKNNYKKEVFNGDIGRVSGLDKKNSLVFVDYMDSDGLRVVTYEKEELDELSLAYAISVHKSQGSEYPAVIIPLMPEHSPLLQRNLVYTAMTRGRQLVIFVGDIRSLEKAINNNRPLNRFSSLGERFKA